MKKDFLFLVLLSSLAFLVSCTKELSHENSGIPSAGSLQSDVTGDCLPKNVGGIYEAGTALSANNFLEVEVNVTKAGSYTITSDTLNGIHFRATGVFTSTGLTIVRLKASGTPVNAGLNTYTISYNGTECSIAVSILPAGGASPASFTLAGAPAACISFDLSGTYTQGAVLTGPGNNVVLDVNVTTIGTYNITTTANNGITFSGTGVFLTTGAGTVTLIASGTPAATGTTNISVTAGSSTCSFPVEVTGPATYTITCGTESVNGDYEENIVLDASNTVSIDVNVTVIGGYNITGTINGMTFSDAGTFPVTGVQTVTLSGTGKPLADGDFDVTVNGSTGSCSFEVTVDPGTTPPPPTDLKWTLKEGATTYEGPTDIAIVLPLGTMQSMGVIGSDASGDLSFNLTLTKPGTMSTGTFSTTSMTNIATVALVDFGAGGTPLYTGLMGMGNLTVNLTTYDVTNLVAEGTFTGTAANAANQIVPISGTFKVKLQL